MQKRYILTINLSEEVYNAYYKKYLERKKENRNFTHDDMIRELLLR